MYSTLQVGVSSLILQIRKLRLKKGSSWLEGTEAASGGARIRPSSVEHRCPSSSAQETLDLASPP